MRLLAVTSASLLASVVSGIGLADLPKCAQSCVPSDLGGCGQLDVSCICNNKSLISNLACCVSKQCNTADQKKTIAFAQSICSGSNADIPTKAGCSSSGSSSSSAAASESTDNAASRNMLDGAALGLVAAGLLAAV